MASQSDERVPARRTANLVVRVQGDETLVLDKSNDTVHCLPAEVGRVWDACTGDRTLAQIAETAAVGEAVAASAVAQLIELDLLAAPSGLDRRKFLRRTAMVGAGAIAVPVVQSVLAPSALAASSTAVVTSASLAEIACSPAHKLTFTVSVTGTANQTFYAIASFYETSSNTTQTVPFTIATGAGGTGTSAQTQTTQHTGPGTYTVTIYADSAHTQLLYTLGPSTLVGCP